MSQSSKSSSTGYLVGLGATICLSFTSILISYLSRQYQLPSLVLAFWRDLFVVLSLLLAFAAFSRTRLRIDRSLWKFFLLYGFILSLFNSMWTFSVRFNGATVATVLAFSSPAMTAVLAHFLLDEQINRVKIISISLSLPGIMLVSGATDPAAWSVNAVGIVTGVLTGLAFAGYNIMGKTSTNKGINPWTTLFYGFSNAMVFLFLFNLLVNAAGGGPALGNFLWLGSSLSGWALLLLLGMGPTIGGFGLYLLSLRYLSATVANLIGALEPAFTTVWAFLLFHDELTVIQVVGSLLVFASVILLRFGEERSLEVLAA